MTQARRLLVFARNPVPGRVKTRLIPALGRSAATAIYRRLLHDTLSTGARLAGTRRELWLDSDAPLAEILHLAARHGMTLHTQQGADLGARMALALDRAAAACPALLIGTDCPELDAAYLEAAFAALADHEVVIGPAADGGYVSIGMTRPQPSLFHGVPWGTDRVLEATRRRLHRLGLRWHELPVRRDVDLPADLRHFPALAALAGKARPAAL